MPTWIFSSPLNNIWLLRSMQDNILSYSFYNMSMLSGSFSNNFS